MVSKVVFRYIVPHEGPEMVKVVGNSGQISLGKRFAGQYYQVEHLEDGAILLRPVKIVPANTAKTEVDALEALLRKRPK